jgi:GNAT superfamily N-acetyltransferase
MIRTAWHHDLPALRALFADANDAPYDLSPVAEEKCFGLGIAGSPVVRVAERDGMIEGASVVCGKWLRLLLVARSRRRQGIGRALLRDAESRGAEVVAAEPGNYFTPGVVDSDEPTCAFFRNQGYLETRWTWNLEVRLDEVPPAGDAVRPTHDEADRVLDFVEQEFGRIWRFEAAKAFDTDVPQIFIAEDGGAIAGFAVHDVNNRGLGFFGPTGIAKALRGRGIGRRVLLASLLDLARLGYARAVIPWTESLEFYRRSCGAEPAHRFIAFAKPRP